jgi:hypothetical protein
MRGRRELGRLAAHWWLVVKANAGEGALASRARSRFLASLGMTDRKATATAKGKGKGNSKSNRNRNRNRNRKSNCNCNC